MIVAFACDGDGPVNAGHVVVVNRGDDSGVGHVHVLGVITYVNDFIDALICS